MILLQEGLGFYRYSKFTSFWGITNSFFFLKKYLDRMFISTNIPDYLHSL